jgi:pimeloyl-ACP methyl ester carboxylesterase
MPAFTFEGNRIGYDVYGEGDRNLVLIHGLLMNRHMFERLAPKMAERGNRVICVDLLGHGRSDRPEEVWRYSMTAFAEQVVCLLDALGLEEAVVGGTSLGANVTLELAALAPERLRGMVLEMPVLEDALQAVAMIFTPVMVGLRFGRPAFELLSTATRRIPRTNPLVDIGLDWVRQEPGPSLAVLKGLLLGRSAPPRHIRRTFKQPALVIGHPGDPLHPFSDADMLSEELEGSRFVDASSLLEWRVKPDRLDDELASFLDEVWQAEPARRRRGRRLAATG